MFLGDPALVEKLSSGTELGLLVSSLLPGEFTNKQVLTPIARAAPSLCLPPTQWVAPLTPEPQ